VRAESKQRGVHVVAINIFPEDMPMDLWKRFWQSVGGGNDVVFAADFGHRAVRAFNVRALGTTIIINRTGQVVYRDGFATPYEILRAEVDKAL